jgi:hypothetical protein
MITYTDAIDNTKYSLKNVIKTNLKEAAKNEG